MDIENFLETQEERHAVVHEIIEALDPINRGSSVEMAKEPATADTAVETVASDAGDMVQVGLYSLHLCSCRGLTPLKSRLN
ncbi:hypothetical protein OESDEN_17561 [Oesophagostomum dentatum]|uniref:Uncharacterized protein n=1 Tax=Oesophagostomum dentatum TaxID=61180 RepID=A0A0B1SCU3_OESDE|nr:hypothetical protein OESDEN_17561 [Oesophagostomum dentatum]